jgi:hypothetical protein
VDPEPICSFCMRKKYFALFGIEPIFLVRLMRTLDITGPIYYAIPATKIFFSYLSCDRIVQKHGEEKIS